MSRRHVHHAAKAKHHHVVTRKAKHEKGTKKAEAKWQHIHEGEGHITMRNAPKRLW